MYIDDVLSLNNSWLGEYMHLTYPNEVEVKGTTDTQKSASYLDFQHEIENWGRRFKTNIYDKRDNFIFQ